MSLPPRGAPAHLPTLTEVIEVTEDASAPVALVMAGTPAAAVPAPVPVPVPRPPERAAGPSIDEALVAQRVLADVQRQVDGMLEYRLRESLAPVLARSSEALIRELRQELSRTLKDVVSRAVAQEMARQRSRS